jgi:hypothetical protein
MTAEFSPRGNGAKPRDSGILATPRGNRATLRLSFCLRHFWYWASACGVWEITFNFLGGATLWDLLASMVETTPRTGTSNLAQARFPQPLAAGTSADGGKRGEEDGDAPPVHLTYTALKTLA